MRERQNAFRSDIIIAIIERHLWKLGEISFLTLPVDRDIDHRKVRLTLINHLICSVWMILVAWEDLIWLGYCIGVIIDATVVGHLKVLLLIDILVWLAGRRCILFQGRMHLRHIA